MDHPHTIEAVTRNSIVPVGDLEDVYVGPCHESYAWNGQQWAVPIDAACHVAAFRSNRVIDPPANWSEVFEMADSGIRVTVPLAGVHALMALLTAKETIA